MPIPVFKKPRKKPPLTGSGIMTPAPVKAPERVLNTPRKVPPKPKTIAGQVVPPPTPTYGAAPVTAQGQAMRSDAEKAMAGVNTDWRDSVYRSVMGLGDPTLVDKYKTNPAFAGYNFVVDPTSTFSQLGEGEKRGLQDVNDASLRNNTFFSGRRLNDRDDVNQDYTYQRAGAVHSFQDALAEYARTLAGGKSNYNQALTDANTVDFNAANAIEPTPAASAAKTYVPGISIRGKPVSQEDYNNGAWLEALLQESASQQKAKKAKKKKK